MQSSIFTIPMPKKAYRNAFTFCGDRKNRSGVGVSSPNSRCSQNHQARRCGHSPFHVAPRVRSRQAKTCGFDCRGRRPMSRNARKTSEAQLAQVYVCRGGCCGPRGKGRRRVPAAWLRALSKRLKLTSSVPLTISGCLMPAVRQMLWRLILAGEPNGFGRMEQNH